jgi:hypothetical protein
MRRLGFLALAGLLLFVGLLTACGGGGGGGGSTGSSDWDEMVWNEDVWGPTAP